MRARSPRTAGPEAQFTFYEIDGAVARIASNPQYFTFLHDSKAHIRIVIGDGRLKIAAAPDRSYDLVVLDAFSSDSVPVHLLTREAVELYLQKLRPNGLLAFHISNNYLDLKPVVGGIARSLGCIALAQDYVPSSKLRARRREPFDLGRRCAQREHARAAEARPALEATRPDRRPAGLDGSVLEHPQRREVVERLTPS